MGDHRVYDREPRMWWESFADNQITVTATDVFGEGLSLACLFRENMLRNTRCIDKSG